MHESQSTSDWNINPRVNPNRMSRREEQLEKQEEPYHYWILEQYDQQENTRALRKKTTPLNVRCERYSCSVSLHLIFQLFTRNASMP
jgi:hypothetical protein